MSESFPALPRLHRWRVEYTPHAWRGRVSVSITLFGVRRETAAGHYYGSGAEDSVKLTLDEVLANVALTCHQRFMSRRHADDVRQGEIKTCRNYGRWLNERR